MSVNGRLAELEAQRNMLGTRAAMLADALEDATRQLAERDKQLAEKSELLAKAEAQLAEAMEAMA